VLEGRQFFADEFSRVGTVCLAHIIVDTHSLEYNVYFNTIAQRLETPDPNGTHQSKHQNQVAATACPQESSPNRFYLFISGGGWAFFYLEGISIPLLEVKFLGFTAD
jgi:hypothetical protein